MALVKVWTILNLVMTEEEVIAHSSKPYTRDAIGDDLSNLGVRSGMTLLVHASLSKLGWVCGGAMAVVQALLDVLGPDGTLVMPTHTSSISDPMFWHNPPVPSDWWPAIRQHLPAFQADISPTYMMGHIAELFRNVPGTLRSQHPQYSFAAKGPNALRITADHPYNFGLGDGSPLDRIYELRGHVLLLGVGHDRNTSLHLAEHRTDWVRNKRVTNGAAVLRDGVRTWVTIEDYELMSHDFDVIGRRFAKKFPELVCVGNVGQGRAELLEQRPLIDFAIRWMEEHR